MNYRWLALEPIQILQSLIATPVTLVAGRPILVRGYVRLENWDQDFTADLEICVVDKNKNECKPDWTKPDRATCEILTNTLDGSTTEYLSRLTLDDSEYLQLCRNTLNYSLNWLVQPEDFACGLTKLTAGKNYFLELEAMAKSEHSSPKNNPQNITNKLANREPAPPPLESYHRLSSEKLVFGRDFGAFEITGDPGLRVNTLGLRYLDTYGDEAYPTVEDHQYARAWSYLAASFPVGKVNWTTLNLNAPTSFTPPFTSGRRSGTDYLLQTQIDTANAFVAAVRANDMTIGVDPSTFYYGMVNAADNQFEGAASNVPDNASHLAVATGPADNTTGYYCAHELAHLLGLTHKGGVNQKSENFHDWQTRPRRASNERRDDVLLRMDRDGVQRQKLPWKDTFDLMSYGEHTWPGYSTHFDLSDRLLQLHDRRRELANSVNTPTALPSSLVLTNSLYISGIYDLRSGEGRLLHVIPLRHSPALEKDFEHQTRTKNTEADSTTISDDEKNTNGQPSLSLIVQPIGGKAQLVISEADMILRRKPLDFPSETGMFQALITRESIDGILKSCNADPPWMLTLIRNTIVLDSSDSNSQTNATQLDQIALTRVLHNESICGRIRPSELNLQRTYDGRGFNLRIDKQLAFNSLIDCAFIVEACSIDEPFSIPQKPCVWRTVALNARVGEDIFLDARKDGVLRLTESLQQRKRKAFEKQLERERVKKEREVKGEPGESEIEVEVQKFLDGINSTKANIEDSKIRHAASEKLRSVLKSHHNAADHHLKLSLADRASIFVARIRIVATRGLDRVVVFDGLLQQSTVDEDRTICISIERRCQIQQLTAESDDTHEIVKNEERAVNSLLSDGRDIASEMEIISSFGLIPSEGLLLQDAITMIGIMQGVFKSTSVIEINSSSNEFKLPMKAPNGEPVCNPEHRALYFSIK